MLTVIGTGTAIFVPLGGLLWKMAKIERAVEGMKGLCDHVADLQIRQTKIETQHDCCPVCNGDHHHE
jgi:hypothetical protein